MKSILLNSWYIIFAVIVFFLIANVTISFSPFKIQFEKPFTAIGWFLIVLGVSFIIGETKVQSEHKGVIKGMNQLSDSIQTEIREGRFFDNLR